MESCSSIAGDGPCALDCQRYHFCEYVESEIRTSGVSSAPLPKLEEPLNPHEPHPLCPNFGNGECRDREIGEERDLRADVYQRASALSLAIALVSVVLAAFFAAPVTGSSLTPSPIIDNSARAVLIRTMTASERVAFANSGVIPIVDYGAFVLATVSGQASAALQAKGMILRTLTDRSTLYLGSVSFDTAKAEPAIADNLRIATRSEEHTSELQSRGHLVCRLLLEKKK